MCAWRNDLRFVEMNSRYKANVFRRFSRVVERVMGTSLFPVKFTMPVYTSDDPDPLAPYSDAVMYQLIGACVSDIETIMEAAKGFKQLGDTVFVPETELYAKGLTGGVLCGPILKVAPFEEVMFRILILNRMVVPSLLLLHQGFRVSRQLRSESLQRLLN